MQICCPQRRNEEEFEKMGKKRDKFFFLEPVKLVADEQKQYCRALRIKTHAH